MSEYTPPSTIPRARPMMAAFGFLAGLLWPSVRYGDKPPFRNPPPWDVA